MRDQLRRLTERQAPRRKKDWELGIYLVLHRRHRKVFDQHRSDQTCAVCGTEPEGIENSAYQ
jgi:hypothetical protein